MEDRVAFARLGAATALVLLVLLGSVLSPLAFVGLLALVMVGLTAFETARTGGLATGWWVLDPGVCPQPPPGSMVASVRCGESETRRTSKLVAYP